MDCAPITEVEQEAFAAALETVRRPYKATVELTQRCNNACTHCYLDPAGQVPPPDAEVSFLLELFDALAAEQCLWLTLTGGEPLLHDDFVELYEAGKRRGFLMTVFTNARLITEEIADLFYRLPPRLVSVGFYGATAATYDAVSRVPGSFEEAMAGIRRLHRRGIPAHLKAMVLRSNQHEVDGLRALAADLGWQLHLDAGVQPTLAGGRHVLSERLTPEEAVAIDTKYADRSEMWREKCAERPEMGPVGRLFACAAGYASVFVATDGAVHPCSVARQFRWPLDRADVCGSLRRVFYEELPVATDPPPPGEFLCAECQVQDLCATCPGWRELETGSFWTPCSFHCRVAELRAQAFGLDGAPPSGVSG
jgi:MoaA/NifB/PqqE/SkfB family radical SAM enzyme